VSLWIRVEERLPEDGADCWITTDGNKAVMWAYISDGAWYFDGDDTPIESLVLAWQPIHRPELYQP